MTLGSKSQSKYRIDLLSTGDVWIKSYVNPGPTYETAIYELYEAVRLMPDRDFRLVKITIEEEVVARV